MSLSQAWEFIFVAAAVSINVAILLNNPKIHRCFKVAGFPLPNRQMQRFFFIPSSYLVPQFLELSGASAGFVLLSRV